MLEIKATCMLFCASVALLQDLNIDPQNHYFALVVPRKGILLQVRKGAGSWCMEGTM